VASSVIVLLATEELTAREILTNVLQTLVSTAAHAVTLWTVTSVPAPWASRDPVVKST